MYVFFYFILEYRIITFFISFFAKFSNKLILFTVENTDFEFFYRHLLDFVITALTIHAIIFVIAGGFLLLANLIVSMI